MSIRPLRRHGVGGEQIMGGGLWTRRPVIAMYRHGLKSRGGRLPADAHARQNTALRGHPDTKA
jgi:uncharacterized protein (UPF0210 family)